MQSPGASFRSVSTCKVHSQPAMPVCSLQAGHTPTRKTRGQPAAGGATLRPSGPGPGARRTARRPETADTPKWALIGPPPGYHSLPLLLPPPSPPPLLLLPLELMVYS